MTHYTINCPKCRGKFSPEQLNRSGTEPCIRCNTLTRIWAYPALHRATGKPRKEIVIDDSAACYFHPGNRAEKVCSSCGRFVCALCRFEMDSEDICPRCIEKEIQQGNALFKARVWRDDWIAFSLSVLPVILSMLMFWPAIFIPFTSTAAIVIVLRSWNKTMETIPLSRFRMAMAFIFGTIQWLAIIAVIMIHIASRTG